MEPHPLQPMFNGINPQHFLMAITPSLFHIWREQRLTLPLSRPDRTPLYRAKRSSWMTTTLRLNILELGQEIRALSMRGLFRMVSQWETARTGARPWGIRLRLDSQASQFQNTNPDGLSIKLGTSVSIYGIFSWFQLGSLTATYTLDGTSTSQTYLVTTRSPQYVANDGEASNFILFSSQTLAAGDHTLVINITQCVNQTFILDYITYTPSFSTLALMPNLTGTSLPTTTFSAVPSGSPSSVLNGSQVSQSNIETKKTPIGAIVGGVIGGVLVVLLMGFLLGYRRRRRSSYMVGPEPSGTQNGGRDANCECSLFKLFRNIYDNVFRREFWLSRYRAGITFWEGFGSFSDIK